MLQESFNYHVQILHQTTSGLGRYLNDKPENQACLVIIGAIQGTSRQTIFDELVLYTLIKRRWYSKLTSMVYYQNISIHI